MIAGAAAARYALSGGEHARQYAVSTGRGVRYAVPQRVNAGTDGTLDIYFRVATSIAAKRSKSPAAMKCFSAAKRTS